MIISQSTEVALCFLGSLIKASRQQRKFSQNELADRLGVTRQTVVNIEKGSAKVSIGTVFEAARVVGIPILCDNNKQLNQWQQVLNGFNALLPSKTHHKKSELDDDF